MVTTGNNIGSFNHLSTSQTLVKTKLGSANTSAKHTKENFSSVLKETHKKPEVKPKADKVSLDAANFSPLMLRYGASKIHEIQNIAKAYGVGDLTNQDFDYAIRYGQSILADYLV